MSVTTDLIILSNLQRNDTYARKVLPFIKEEYFLDDSSKFIFKSIKQFIDKYDSLPTITAIEADIEKSSLTEIAHKNVNKQLEEIKQYTTIDNDDWLIDETESFCQDRSLYLALTEAISISNGEHKNLSKTAIPKLLEDALAVSFKSKIGHDYEKDALSRALSYTAKPDKIPFLLRSLNDITKGGFERKTINCLLAGCVHPTTKIYIRRKKKT